MNRRGLGRAYEERAAHFLEQKGYRILARNYSTRYGEIDLVAQEGEVLCFVEVKYRKNSAFGWPGEAVGREKQRKLSFSASVYLMKEQVGLNRPMRFDVVSIIGEEYTLIRDAFPYAGG